MSKHTPGPWSFYIPEGVSVNPNQAAFLIGPTRLPMDKVVGFKIEDAQLISQGPRLLVALEAAVAFINSHCADPDITAEMREAYAIYLESKAPEVIAKAKGESA